MKWFIIAFLALAASCSPPAEFPGCIDEEPEALDRACTGDGECGNWLVCGGDACELPAAVVGEGGSTARIVSTDTTTELRVEVARSDLARMRGLGHRPCIADGWGLLIDYPSPGSHLITTEAMRFDLDIAMIGTDGVIHTVHRGAPAGGEALYGSEYEVASVLEVPSGAIDLAAGDRLELY